MDRLKPESEKSVAQLPSSTILPPPDTPRLKPVGARVHGAKGKGQTAGTGQDSIIVCRVGTGQNSILVGDMAGPLARSGSVKDKVRGCFLYVYDAVNGDGACSGANAIATKFDIACGWPRDQASMLAADDAKRMQVLEGKIAEQKKVRLHVMERE